MPRRRCFVISPIGPEGSEAREHADDVFDYIIQPAAKECGVRVYRADQVHKSGRISDQMFRAILEEDFCIALLTGLNPNVFYELAIAQAVGKPVIALVDRKTVLPFDVQDLRCVQYDYKPRPLYKGVAAQEVVKHIRSIEARDWQIEPLLTRYGASATGMVIGRSSRAAEAEPALDICCHGELCDLLHIDKDSSHVPTPDSDKWQMDLTNGRLRSSGGSAWFNFQLHVETAEGDRTRFQGFGQGAYEASSAYMVYRLQEDGRRRSRGWFGVMVLRIPMSGRMFGVWMTTNVLEGTHICMGTIRLEREEPVDGQNGEAQAVS
jgi:hypothetical protein